MKARLVGSVAGGLLVADGVTKWMVARSFRPGESTPVLGDLVRLTYVLNPGAAFGIHVGPYSREILTGLALVATALVLTVVVRTPRADRVRLVALALVLGGAVGNLADRIARADGVVDFLDVGLGGLRWPVFNLADVGVTTGAVLLLLMLRQRSAVAAREEEARVSGARAGSPGSGP